MANQRHPKHQRFLGQFVEPAFRAQPRRGEPQIEEASRAAIDQRLRAELLGEASELARRGGPLLQIHEVGLDPSLGEEAKCLAGFGTLLDAEDLDFHGVLAMGYGLWAMGYGLVTSD